MIAILNRAKCTLNLYLDNKRKPICKYHVKRIIYGQFLYNVYTEENCTFTVSLDPERMFFDDMVSRKEIVKYYHHFGLEEIYYE